MPTCYLTLVLLMGPAATEPAATEPAATEKVRYVRPAGEQFVTECEFFLTRTDQGHTIASTTRRGNLKMSVTASYKDADALIVADATMWTGEQKKTATVRVDAGKALIERPGQKPLTLAAPPGVIVTSAPDWTDIFLLCRRYDRKRGGRQAFAGLWIHPEQPCKELKFFVERQGADTILHDGQKRNLDRFTIQLRGNSTYAAWADAQGTLIKLVPLPYKDGAMNWFVAQGYERSAAALVPAARPPLEK